MNQVSVSDKELREATGDAKEALLAKLVTAAQQQRTEEDEQLTRRVKSIGTQDELTAFCTSIDLNLTPAQRVALLREIHALRYIAGTASLFRLKQMGARKVRVEISLLSDDEPYRGECWVLKEYDNRQLVTFGSTEAEVFEKLADLYEKYR